MQTQKIYVVSQFNDWGDNRNYYILGSYDSLESAKQDADDRLNDIIKVYNQDGFPNKSLDIGDWSNQSINQQVRVVYADAAKGAAKDGIICYMQIDCTTLVPDHDKITDYKNAYTKIINSFNTDNVLENFIADLLTSRMYDMTDNVYPGEDIGPGKAFDSIHDYYQTLKHESQSQVLANCVANAYLTAYNHAQDLTTLVTDNSNIDATPVNDIVNDYYNDIGYKLTEKPNLNKLPNLNVLNFFLNRANLPIF